MLPVSVLNQVNAARFEWLTMGMLREKCAAYFKSLPQRFRSQLVPVPETVSAFITHITQQAGMNDLSNADVPLVDALTTFLHKVRGIEVPRDAWDVAPEGGRIAPHLYMNYRVVDADGKELAMSRDFAGLKAQFAAASRTVFSTLHRNALERDGLHAWPADLAEIPATINFERNGIRYDGFPALLDRGGSVEIKIFDEALAAEHAHRQGLMRLFMLSLAEQAKFCERSIKVSPIAAFQFASFFVEAKNQAQEALRQELVHGAFLKTFVDVEGAELLRDAKQFNAQAAAGKPALAEQAAALTRAIDEALSLVAEVRKLSEDRFLKGWEHLLPDVDQQLRQLFSSRFLRETSGAQLLHYPRYLKAILMRLTKVKQGGAERDLENHKQIRPLWQHWLNATKGNDVTTADLLDYRWAVEELRVGLYAQELRTPMPVSIKRVGKMWDELENARR